MSYRQTTLMLDRIAELEAALRPFASIAETLHPDAADDGWLVNYLTEDNDPLVIAVRRAVELLKKPIGRGTAEYGGKATH